MTSAPADSVATLSPAPHVSPPNSSIGGKAGWAVLLAVLAVQAVFLIRNGVGIEDSGFVLNLSWRIAHGAVPYRDFIYVRTDLTPYLHVLPLAFGDYSIYADRVMTLLQLAAVALAGADVIRRAVSRPWRSDLLVPLTLSILVWTITTEPVFGWHTLDGLFFATLGSWALTTCRWSLAGVLMVAAFLCKQNFAAVLAFGTLVALVGGIGPTLRYGLAAAAVLVVWIAKLAATSALQPMLAQVFGGSSTLGDLWRAGFLGYYWATFAPRNLAVLAALAPIGVGLGFYKRDWRVGLVTAYGLYILALLARFGVEVWVKINAAQPYQYSVASFEKSAALWLVALGCILVTGLVRFGRELLSRPVLLGTVCPIAGLFAVAWAAAISWGAPFPDLGGAAFMAPIALAGTVLMAVRWFWILGLAGLAVFGFGQLYPYDEGRPIWDLVDVPQTFHHSALIRTSQETVDKLTELQAFAGEHSGRPMAVLPGFPLADLILGRIPTAPLDLMFDAEIPSSQRTAVLTRLCRQKSLVALDPAIVARHAPEDLHFHSSIAKTIQSSWTRLPGGNLFEIYDPPAVCPDS